ncbi:putative IQ calmodulin-binding motif-containing protein 1 [Apostichopus japonicus]|uniref:Putative IQ calmodulin-binding motif-containing protein 1 n=1 Tax=Stichopus japonicus TaxID=307972 RepID=A0A2G8L9G2_STIJA|nr:putative IQ calmodulin-binding motif-containing protein 1 [Apostichopus japonicus]
MDNRTTVEEKLVEDLAAHVAETTDRNVPVLLLALQDILDKVVPGSQKAEQVKKAIWKFDLLQSVLIALKQDFSQNSGKWKTASSLTKILAYCSVGLDPPDSHEFHAIFLPDSVERLLILCRNLQHRYTKIPEGATVSTKKDLLQNFNEVLESLRWLHSGHVFLATNVLRSNYLLQMIITDDKETGISLLGAIQSAVRVNPSVLDTLDEKLVHSLLDEIIYKLSAFSDAELGAAATRALVNIADVYQPLIKLLYSRYKGLRPLLSRWTGKGFGRDLKKLLELLDAGSAQEAEMQRLHRAATTVQAIIRGFLARRRLKKADKAFANLQKNYRIHQEKKDEQKASHRQERELQHQLLLSRRRAIRETRQRQLDMIAAMHPAEIDKYLEISQIQAAVKLQAIWRGVLERRKLGLRKATAQQVRAAITIQRHIRRYLKRQDEKRKEPMMWQPPPGLTDERRVELQSMIEEKRTAKPSKVSERADQEDLHLKAQDAWMHYLSRRLVMKKGYQRREALLASLEMDADLLATAPKLSDATNRDVYTFTSHSAPVAAKALANHREEVNMLRQPWWKKMHLEDKNEDDVEGMEEAVMF